jgi:neutral ceramidase
MRIRLGQFVLALAVVTAPACFGQVAAPAPTGALRAGAAKVDITPKESDLKIKTDTIRDHLFVRAIVVASPSTCAVLVGMDQGGVSLNVYKNSVDKVAQATGCPVDNIEISATHTHSGSAGGFGGPPTQDTVVAAIIKAATDAKAKLAPCTVGYGRSTLDLNVNRDLFNSKLEWRQQPNVQGVSDKTLSVVEFIGADFIPIGVYMNYAMHPINFYLAGVVSADFPGEASRFIEDHFDGKTVAIFTQGTSGDQNPMLKEAFLSSARTGGQNETEQIGAPPPPPPSATPGFNPATAGASLKEVAPENLAGYRKAVARVSADVTMMGTLVAEKTLYMMRNDIHPVAEARLWGGQEDFTCPGRDRTDNPPVRENAMPPYKEGADVNLKVSLLRIGDIYFAAVNGEVYTNIGLKLKKYAPANNLIISTLTNGGANSGYIYSDDAYSHLSFQVIGSRLKPGCAENKIVNAALDLMNKSEN